MVRTEFCDSQSTGPVVAIGRDMAWQSYETACFLSGMESGLKCEYMQMYTC